MDQFSELMIRKYLGDVPHFGPHEYYDATYIGHYWQQSSPRDIITQIGLR